MTTRAVLFDLGNTLLEYSLAGHWREFLVQRLEELYPLVCELASPISLSPTQFAATVGEIIGGKEAQAIERNGHSWHFAERLRNGLTAVGLSTGDPLLDWLTDAFYKPIRECTAPYPDTHEALETLRSQGMQLAIVTNSPWDTPARLLRGDLERWDLDGFFDAFLCSGELPWRKPNPAFMLAAAEALRVPPQECLVVGDMLEVDIAGAIAAGMRSIWVNREDATAAPEGLQPDWTMQSLAEITEALRKQ